MVTDQPLKIQIEIHFLKTSRFSNFLLLKYRTLYRLKIKESAGVFSMQAMNTHSRLFLSVYLLIRMAFHVFQETLFSSLFPDNYRRVQNLG